MKWDRTTISASEVNRYTYCPYQWYYERYYGRSKLLQLAKAKRATESIAPKKRASAQQKNASHLARGRAYHAREYRNFKRKQKAVFFCLGVLLVFCVVLGYFVFLR